MGNFLLSTEAQSWDKERIERFSLVLESVYRHKKEAIEMARKRLIQVIVKRHVLCTWIEGNDLHWSLYWKGNKESTMLVRTHFPLPELFS